MKRFHIAFGVVDVEASVKEYSEKLGQEADIYVIGEYALWKTPEVNFSIRKTTELGFRHIGFEDPESKRFSDEKDINGILWEEFSEQAQIEEILSCWPEAQIKK